jgi:hypothetical protein
MLYCGVIVCRLEDVICPMQICPGSPIGHYTSSIFLIQDRDFRIFQSEDQSCSNVGPSKIQFLFKSGDASVQESNDFRQ